MSVFDTPRRRTTVLRASEVLQSSYSSARITEPQDFATPLASASYVGSRDLPYQLTATNVISDSLDFIHDVDLFRENSYLGTESSPEVSSRQYNSSFPAEHVALPSLELVAFGTTTNPWPGFDANIDFIGTEFFPCDPDNRVPQPPAYSLPASEAVLGHEGNNCCHVEFASQHSNRARNASIRQWLLEHASDPYPSAEQIENFAIAENKTVHQIQIAFRNLRQRMKLNNIDNSFVFQPERVGYAVSNIYDDPTDWLRVSDDDFASLETDIHPKITDNIGIDPAFSPLRQNICIDASTSSSSPTNTDGSTIRAASQARRKGRKRHASRYKAANSGQDTLSTTHEPIAGPSRSIKNAHHSFHCTVCTKSFESAFSWKRHEEGVHWFTDTLWTCLFHEEMILGTSCTFCKQLIFDAGHLEEHGIRVCSAEHVFSRKDLLKQHVQLVHLKSGKGCPRNDFTIPRSWTKAVDMVDVNPDALWCGFCYESMNSVTQRMEHVKKHFLDGWSMEYWIPRVAR